MSNKGNRPNFCNCKPCRKAQRKGLVLGTRQMGFWRDWGNGVEYYLGPVSDYVQHIRFAKGRVRKERSFREEISAATI